MYEVVGKRRRFYVSSPNFVFKSPPNKSKGSYYRNNANALKTQVSQVSKYQGLYFIEQNNVLIAGNELDKAVID